ncbi:cupin domain-containing protein [Salipaludibacillus agaradhaerens]|uniref:cupin domain-containing protein n=1 Tax=Salipaludibacillus agaradhaerens TaxID=76935 RepID=UPI001472D677|nr:cupin domain-containing protein [Salipaludibacillus agaradhaerens]
MITISKDHLQDLSEGRKMLINEVVKEFKEENGQIVFPSFEKVKETAEFLNIPLASFFDEENSDLESGVKILRDGEGFSRTSLKNGNKYYTYNHLVTTNTEPSLMPLRVELHVKDEDHVTLNGGHGSKEMVYITKGVVRMHWEHNKEQKSIDLNKGDSVYIKPGVPHSFISAQDDSELLAFNY